jgi:hypothetical protein
MTDGSLTKLFMRVLLQPISDKKSSSEYLGEIFLAWIVTVEGTGKACDPSLVLAMQ